MILSNNTHFGYIYIIYILFLPANFKQYCAQVRQIDLEYYSLPVLFMDDTGATYPTIHATELALLDVQEDYLGWGFPVWFDTANDPVPYGWM